MSFEETPLLHVKTLHFKHEAHDLIKNIYFFYVEIKLIIYMEKKS